jgi:hypothetical protein
LIVSNFLIIKFNELFFDRFLECDDTLKPSFGGRTAGVTWKQQYSNFTTTSCQNPKELRR